MRSYRFVLLALMLGACGGAEPVAADPPRPVRQAPPAPPAPVAPLEIAIAGTRVGAALRLDIEVIGSAATGGRSVFEDPDRWTIEASQAGEPLTRLANGSTAVERAENDRGWDTVVRFNTTVQLRDSSTVAVTLTPPGRPSVTRTLEPGEAPEPVPGAPDPAEVAAAKEAAAKAKADARAKKHKKKHKQRRSTR